MVAYSILDYEFSLVTFGKGVSAEPKLMMEWNLA